MQIVHLNIGRVSVIVYSSLVLKGPRLIKGEDMWCADCAIFSRNILCLVPEVLEIEAFVFGSLDHVFEAVFWIVVIIVAVDRDESDALPSIVALQLNHSVLVGLNIWAMVATENYNKRLPVREVFQTVTLSVDGFQLEIDGCAPEWDAYGT